MKQQIREQMMAATKAGRTIEKEILKVVVADIESAEYRNAGQPLSTEDVYKVVKSIVKGVEEMLQYQPNNSTLLQEREVLVKLMSDMEKNLPRYLTLEEISGLLKDAGVQIRNAAKDGQATGIAIRHLKEKCPDSAFSGDLVAQVVKEMRCDEG